MALNAVQLQSRIDALQAARDSGVLMLRHGDTHTTFRSLDEMNQTLATLQAQLEGLAGKQKSRIKYVRQDDRGFGR